MTSLNALFIALGVVALGVVLVVLRKRHHALMSVLGGSRADRREIYLASEKIMVPMFRAEWDGTPEGLQPIMLRLFSVAVRLLEERELKPTFFAAQQLIGRACERSGMMRREMRGRVGDVILGIDERWLKLALARSALSQGAQTPSPN